VEKSSSRAGEIFHTVEKSTQSFSIVWKNRQKFFHCVEKFGPGFPHCGKFTPYFSTLWKNSSSRVGGIFHTVEKLSHAAPAAHARGC